MKAQLTSISFEGLDSGTGLATGQCDIALAGIGVTDERKSKMEFTTVYFDDNLAILVPKGSSITSAADLKGVTVGAQQATSGEPTPRKTVQRSSSTKTPPSCSPP